MRIVGFLPALILFGYRPAGPSWRELDVNCGPLPFVRIQHWWKPFGFHFMPGAILFWMGVAWSFGTILWLFIWHVIIQRFFMETVFGTKWGPWVFGPLALAIVFLVLRMKTRNTEEYQMVMGFVKAKKDRFCPTVEFK
ncbi:MAG: hypothetical protein AAB758_00265 [Patescibacteria group bacterium]